MFNDLGDFFEDLADELEPVMKVWRMLNFVFKVSRVDSAKANFLLQLKNQELAWEDRNEIFANQLVEFRESREAYVEELANQRADRVLIDRHIFLLKKIYENTNYPAVIRDAALDDHLKLIEAMTESFKVSVITIGKIPYVQFTAGRVNFPALN
jgi:hypothetical protein